MDNTNDMNNNMNIMNNNLNAMINFMNQINNNMNINNINNNMNYNDMINKINFNLNNINYNLNNIINSMNNIKNILLEQQNNNYTPINFIKEIINQNILMANQISYNSNIINLTINNPQFFKNNNNINAVNNQMPNSNLIQRRKIHYVNLFPENKNIRINILFQTQKGYQFNIAAPVHIRVKDLLLASAREMAISPALLGKEIFFYLMVLK